MKVLTVNNIYGKQFQGSFETQQKLDSWKEKHIKNNTWGKPEREEKDSETLTQVDKDRAIKQTQVTDENGEAQLVYTIPSEYELVQEEVVEDYKEMRRREYLKISHLLEEGTYEALIENRPEKLEEYKLLRRDIKIRYPKPE